jgi:shikimate kinase/3-dehydroquinate synthase
MQMIVLIGLSGSGKTTVGKLLAQALGWHYIDLDQQIEQQTGQTIVSLFATEGEAAFRALERDELAKALDKTQVVVATGGGVVEDAANRELLRAQAFNVWLHTPVAILLERLSDKADRPLLAKAPATSLQQMAERRMPLYAEIADWVVSTAMLHPHQIVDEILRGYQLHQPAADHGEIVVTTPGGTYPIQTAPNIIQMLPGWLQRLGLGGRFWLVSDDVVMPLHGERVLTALRANGYAIETFAIRAGEEHKNLATVQHVYDWLLSRGVERGDVVLAFGGGVVGDLAGFVAATVLRGIALVQLPTTVLAMVDSAIGGKTGVDHQQGKNLIGAFHQPRLVLADTTVLSTLPLAERAAGWTEAIKHGVIGDAQLFRDLQYHAEAAIQLDEPITSNLLRRAAAFKAGIVSGDEREQGSRILLNYGHTIGHAIEAESGYSLRHGEAVAIGMMAAGTIANQLDMFPNSALVVQAAVLQAFGLPTRVPKNFSLDAIWQRIASDKKIRAKRVRWVLPTAIGAATVREDVPEALVLEVLRRMKDEL